MELGVTAWNGNPVPTEENLRQLMEAEGLRPYSWGNGPHDTYAAHSHAYDKVIFVLNGSIVFGLPEHGTQLELGPGDRLDLPRGTVHDAIVGSEGVTCLEAHKD